MRNSISRFPNFIARTLAAGLAVAVVASAGVAAGEPTPQQRAMADMNSGKDYSAAWAAASLASRPPGFGSADRGANQAQSAMNAGKDYQAAWQTRPAADSGYSSDQVAAAKRFQKRLNEGLDYASSWGSHDETEPTRVRAMRVAPIRSADGGRVRTSR